ncbi:MAG: polymer-forming cytoskeletal protein [Rhodocyclaceae bacterium]|nr:polymer-forming cytoskeletal protein [Rhodocyclaceae bacterium]
MFSKPSILNRNDNNSNKDGRSLSSPNTLSASLSNQTPSPKPATVAPLEVTPPPKPVATNSSEPVIGARLIVGPDVKLKGAEILDCDTLVVEGRVEATMDSRVIRIAENGAFAGKVSIDIAEIHGHFEGDLTARTQLIIHATGRVSGKIRYGKLVIDEGGELCGDINSLSAENLPSQQQSRETPPGLNVIAL